MIHLYVDAMGGDLAPQAPVLGALEALRAVPDLRLTLGGDAAVLEPLLAKESFAQDRLQIDHAPDTITNHDAPALAIRSKKNSSIVRGMLAVREERADGFVSAGSTGAVMLGGMLRLGRVAGIERPALAPIMPGANQSFLLIDCGANVDCRPEWLVQFGLMGSVYMEHVQGVQKPRVGLINIGEEPEKGNQLYKQAHELMQKADYHFIGNVEARYITSDRADVLVCDGFDGNLILKFTEGFSDMLLNLIKKEIMADWRSRLGGLLTRAAFRRVKQHTDYQEIGGAPLLGVQGAVVKAHGSSNDHAFAQALRQATGMAREQVAQVIREKIGAMNA